jgi:DNA-binding protein Fis
LIELGNQLEKTNIGIFCLTRENLKSPWLLFEAGAVGKALKESRVCTYLIGLTYADIGEPLSQFQATLSNKADTYKLLLSINQALGEIALKEAVLEKVFDKFWPDFEPILKSIPPEKEEHTPVRTDHELLEEILSNIRELGRGHAERFTQVPEGYFEKATMDFEKEIIIAALQRCNYVQTKAAELPGISRRILKYKMDKYGIEGQPED